MKSQLAALTLFFLTSCIKMTTGYIFDEDKLSKISVGKTKEEIVTIMGTPTFISTVDPNSEVIFYAQDKIKRFLFINNILQERRIVEIIFNSEGVASEIKNHKN